MSGEFKVTQPDEFRAKNSFPLVVSPRLNVIRRIVDPLDMVLGGLLQLPAVAAAQKFEQLREEMNKADTEDQKVKLSEDFLRNEDKNELLTLLRKFACENVLEPTITMEKPAAHVKALWVNELSFTELLIIFNAEEPETRAPEGSVKSSAQIQEFRRTKPDDAGTAGQPGEKVFTEAKLVPVSPERDAISA